MSRIGTNWRWLALSLVVIAGGVLVGAVVAAQFRSGPTQQQLNAIASDPLVMVEDLPATAGLPARGVFVQPSAGGLFCLWDAASAVSRDRRGGCNRADDPLGGRKIMIGFAYDGGPDVATVTDARLIGLTRPEVAGVQVVMSDGTRRMVQLHRTPKSVGDFQAFGVRFGRGELRRGVTPTAVVALDGAGSEIDRQATGFTH
jgi:hypothetical protein